MRNKLLCILNILFIIIADFTIKKLIIMNANKIDGYRLLNGLIQIVYVENLGAALGFFKGNVFFLVILPIVIVFIFLLMLLKKDVNNVWLLLSISFIVGGGMGNLIDRIKYGYVIDYIKFPFFSPICNLADCFITFGVIALMVYIFLEDKTEQNNVVREQNE